MEPLNYCRQLAKRLSYFGPQQRSKKASRVFELCLRAKKFNLPLNGVLIADKDLKAINEAQRLCLPFNEIALEFPCEVDALAKNIVFALQNDDYIELVYISGRAIEDLAPLPSVYIERDGFLNRNLRDDGGLLLTSFHREDANVPVAVYKPPVVTFYQFINALSCSNVTTETVAPRKQPKKARRGDALPFDTYHVLKVSTHNERAGANHQGGTHRSPREHLRRGHIRRLQDGRRIWVNAAVICAGVGGRVQKDYALVA